MPQNSTSPDEFRIAPLGWASVYGDLNAVQLLIDRWSRCKCRIAAMDMPLFIRHRSWDMRRFFKILIECGADPAALSNNGDSAADSAMAEMGATTYIAGLLRIPVREEEDLLAGREACIQELKRSEWYQKNKRIRPNPLSKWQGSRTAISSVPTVSKPHGSATASLCTLYDSHLSMIFGSSGFSAGSLRYFTLASTFQEHSMASDSHWIVRSKYRTIGLVSHHDSSVLHGNHLAHFRTRILPELAEPHALYYYGLFFSFGLIYFNFENQDGTLKLGSRWKRMLPAALFILFPIGLVMMSNPVIGGLVQATYTWTMVLATGRSKPAWEERSPGCYLSDSAYWLYLAHMPLIVIIQAIIRPWNLPSGLKFLIVCTITTGLLLISYQILATQYILGLALERPPQKPEEASSGRSRAGSIKLKIKAHNGFRGGGIQCDLVLGPKARPHTSLGQSPRYV
jgi:hypothetical protein